MKDFFNSVLGDLDTSSAMDLASKSDPRLGAVIIATHSPNFSEGSVLDLEAEQTELDVVPEK